MSESIVAVLGDVVGSRQHPDRRAMRARLHEALRRTNEQVTAIQPLTPTIGDEFQGIYADLLSALRATMLAALAAKPDVDLRFGIGSGPVEIPEPGSGPYGQDGPAWWAARKAITDVAKIARSRQAPGSCRSLFVSHDEAAEGDVERVANAFLLCRDEIVHRMDLVDVRVLVGEMSGERQRDIADREGISQSAVSQRSRRGGHYTLLLTQQLLGGDARG